MLTEQDKQAAEIYAQDILPDGNLGDKIYPMSGYTVFKLEKAFADGIEHAREQQVCGHPKSKIWQVDNKTFCDNCNKWLSFDLIPQPPKSK
jgi:hypothetical protein